MSHKSELEAIRKLVQSLNGRCNILSQSQRLHGTAGIPDLYCQLLGYWPEKMTLRFWVEVKVGTDKLSPTQRGFAEMERECGGMVIVGGVADVIQHLQAEGLPIK